MNPELQTPKTLLLVGATGLVGLLVLRMIGPLLPRRYRISPAGRVAAALLDAAIRAAPGRHGVEAAELAQGTCQRAQKILTF